MKIFLDAPVSDCDDTEFGEIIGDEDAKDPLEVLSHRNMHSQLDGLLSVLDERERRVIDARFALNGEDSKTLDDLGQEFGLTRERIRQIQNVALKKLRRAFQKCESPRRKPAQGLRPNLSQRKENVKACRTAVDARRLEGPEAPETEEEQAAA